MGRKSRLNTIRRVRAIRDEMLSTDNLGRAEHLCMKLPLVSGYAIGQVSIIRKGVEVTYENGETHTFSGYGDVLNGFRAIADHAYARWLNNYCS